MEIQTKVYDPRKEGLTDGTTKRVNAGLLTKLLFRILQNSRNKMKSKKNEINSKLNLLPSRALPLEFCFRFEENNWPNAATWPRAAKQTPECLAASLSRFQYGGHGKEKVNRENDCRKREEV